MPFKTYIEIRAAVKAADGKCDECGAGLTATTAVMVEDETGRFPVCHGCARLHLAALAAEDAAMAEAKID